MKNVAKLNTDVMELTKRDNGTALAIEPDSPWSAATDIQREKANHKAAIVRPLVRKLNDGVFRSMSQAIQSYLLEVDLYGKERHPLAFELGNKGKPVTRATLHNWVKKFNAEGVHGLVEVRGGSKRKTYEWEVRALNIWQSPQNRAATVVAAMLRQEGHASATDSRVRAFLKSMPADVLARGRAGTKLFSNTQRAYQRITTSHLLPGDVYQGDGNTLDIYMQHPSGKRVWRPELTLWIDVVSRFVVGWHLSSAESGNSTLFALSHALTSQNHVPAMIHTDNGSGFKNKMLSTNATGYYDKLGIEVIKARPYNAKGKGRVERFFRTMQMQFLTRFDSFCGKGADSEHLKKLVSLHKKGEANLPGEAEFRLLFNEWLENEYHNNPHRGEGMDGRSPLEVYESRRHQPLDALSEAIFWPRKELTVNRQTVRLEGHEYFAPQLGAYNGKKVIIEYSPHHTLLVRALTDKGQWICDANLVHANQYVSTDRIELARKKTAAAAKKRKFNDIKEIDRREKMAITHHDHLNNPVLEATTGNVIEADSAQDNSPSTTTINIEDLY